MALGAILGGLGLIQSINASNQQNKLIGKGVKASARISAEQLKALQALNGLASGYDPMREAQAGVDLAKEQSQQTFEQALKNIRGSWGGYAGADSEFHISGQRAANDALDPLRNFIAQTRANATLKKMGAYQTVLSVPAGQIASNYFNAAGAINSPDPSGSLQMLSQGLNSIFKKGNK